MGVDQECFVKGDNIPDHLICKICFLVLETPIKLGNCVHYFCKGCIRGWFARNRTCPTCRAIQKNVNVEALSRQPDPLLVSLLDDEERYCSQRDNKCYWTGPSHRLQAHLADDCLVQQSSRKDDEVRRVKQQLEEISSSKDDEIRSLRQQLDKAKVSIADQKRKVNSIEQQLKEEKIKLLRLEDELNNLKVANQEKLQNGTDAENSVSATPGYDFRAMASAVPIAPPSSQIVLGKTKIEKEFLAGIFKGVVKSRSDEGMYFVQYEDGDSEEMDLNTLLNYLHTEGSIEEVGDASSEIGGGAALNADAVDTRQEGVATLVALGFDKELAKRALGLCGQDVNRAADWLLAKREPLTSKPKFSFGTPPAPVPAPAAGGGDSKPAFAFGPPAGAPAAASASGPPAFFRSAAATAFGAPSPTPAPAMGASSAPPGGGFSMGVGATRIQPKALGKRRIIKARRKK